MAKYSFAVISDPHYFSEKLTDGKRAYLLRSGSDQKCLLESGAIIDSAFKGFAKDKDLDAVLISGDLTNDGELCSHEEFSEKLSELSRHKRVFVTTATHDFCCDGNARLYFGDSEAHLSETADIEYLTKAYAPFGLKDAHSVYENFNGLCSYAVKLCDGVTLLGLNDDQNGKGGSGYNDEHLSWIINQIKEAKKCGDTVIAMQHHVVVPHFNSLLTKGGVCCQDREHIAESFAENGVDILFVGHSHLHNITEYKAKNGNIMTQVNVGSLSGHPAPIFKVKISDEEIEMHTEYVTEFEYCGKKYTGSYITLHSKALISNVLTPAVNGDFDEFSARLGALGIKSKHTKRYFLLIRKICAFVLGADVKSFSKKINALTFGKGIDKKAASQIPDVKALDIAYDIFLNLFDGGLHRYDKDSATYKVVSDFAALPEKITKRLPFIPDNVKQLCAEIHELICLLMNDGTDNNYKKIIIKKEQTP